MRRAIPLLAVAGFLLCLALPSPALAAGPRPDAPTVVAGQVGSTIVPQGSTHYGDIRLAAGSVAVYGTVQGNVFVQMGQVQVAGRVNGKVSVGMGQVVLTHGAQVTGGVQVGMGQIQHLPPGASLPAPSGGGQTTVAIPWISRHFAAFPFALAASFGVRTALRAFWWLVGLATVLILASTFPRGLLLLQEDIERAPLSGFAWGLLLLLAAMPASVLLALTIVGIPLSLLLWLAVIAAKVLGYAAVALLLGRLTLERFERGRASVGVTAVVGTALFLVVGLVPVLGGVVDFVVACLGIGAVLRTGFGSGRPWFRRPEGANP